MSQRDKDPLKILSGMDAELETLQKIDQIYDRHIEVLDASQHIVPNGHTVVVPRELYGKMLGLLNSYQELTRKMWKIEDRPTTEGEN